MSDFDYQPAARTAVSAQQPRVLSAKFGDGYEQRAADGINTMPESWQVEFIATDAEILVIRDFFATKAGVTAFTWTPYGESELLVVCRQWSRPRLGGGISSITAQFDEVAA